MTTEYSTEKVTELIARSGYVDGLWGKDEIFNHMLALTRALEAEHKRAERSVSENGPCWDDGPEYIVPKGQCAPMPPKCELRAGHLGAHQGGRATWMRNPSSYNQVAKERDELRAVIAEALTALNNFGAHTARVQSAKRILSRIPEHDDTKGGAS